jgi:hypothetical protein
MTNEEAAIVRAKTLMLVRALRGLTGIAGDPVVRLTVTVIETGEDLGTADLTLGFTEALGYLVSTYTKAGFPEESLHESAASVWARAFPELATTIADIFLEEDHKNLGRWDRDVSEVANLPYREGVLTPLLGDVDRDADDDLPLPDGTWNEFTGRFTTDGTDEDGDL